MPYHVGSMSDTYDQAPQLEVASFPPEQPILEIPLRGAVELSLGEVQPDSPQARVEAFMEGNSPLRP